MRQFNGFAHKTLVLTFLGKWAPQSGSWGIFGAFQRPSADCGLASPWRMSGKRSKALHWTSSKLL